MIASNSSYKLNITLPLGPDKWTTKISNYRIVLCASVWEISKWNDKLNSCIQLINLHLINFIRLRSVHHFLCKTCWWPQKDKCSWPVLPGSSGSFAQIITCFQTSLCQVYLFLYLCNVIRHVCTLIQYECGKKELFLWKLNWLYWENSTQVSH